MRRPCRVPSLRRKARMDRVPSAEVVLRVHAGGHLGCSSFVPALREGARDAVLGIAGMPVFTWDPLFGASDTIPTTVNPNSSQSKSTAPLLNRWYFVADSPLA